MGNCEDDFENFLHLAEHLVSLAEKLIADRDHAKYIINFEFIYQNLFDEFMKKQPSTRKYLGTHTNAS